MFDKTVGKWADASGPNSDVVISSRLRLARNLAGVRFPARALPEEQEQVIVRAEAALRTLSIYSPERFVRSKELSPVRARYLMERQLVSPGFLTQAATKGEPARERAIFVGPDETLSVMINEEDHLRLQIHCSGLDLASALKELQVFDEALGGELGYAFSEQYGFLSAGPTNLGTGLRASVLVHLPGLALTKEIQKILRGALQVGLVVRGLYGEGSETRGNLFQVYNQVTLGKSEEELVEVLNKIMLDVISYELKARAYLIEKLRLEIEDKVMRAQAVLQSARLLTSDETTNLLGIMRLGVTTGIISRPSLKLLNELMIICRPANLQVYYDRELPATERDALRAELVRAKLIRSEIDSQ